MEILKQKLKRAYRSYKTMPTIDEIEEATTEYRSLLKEVNEIDSLTKGSTEEPVELTIMAGSGRIITILVSEETLHMLLSIERKDKQRQIEHLRREYRIE